MVRQCFFKYQIRCKNEYMVVPFMPSEPLTLSYVLVGERMIIYLFYRPMQRVQHCIYYVSLLKQ